MCCYSDRDRCHWFQADEETFDSDGSEAVNIAFIGCGQTLPKTKEKLSLHFSSSVPDSAASDESSEV